MVGNQERISQMRLVCRRRAGAGVVAFSSGYLDTFESEPGTPQTFRTLADGRLELRMCSLSVELRTWICGFGLMPVLAPSTLIEDISSTLRSGSTIPMMEHWASEDWG